MEAANRGACDAGAPSIGFNITLPHEQEPNAYSTPELTFRFHYFAMRKMHLAMRANALVVFPGGFGTLDELFEILTLRQTGKVPPLPIVLFDRAYWTRIVNFDALIEDGMIAADDLELFDFADDAEDIWAKLVRARPQGAHAGFASAHFAASAFEGFLNAGDGISRTAATRSGRPRPAPRTSPTPRRDRPPPARPRCRSRNRCRR